MIKTLLIFILGLAIVGGVAFIIINKSTGYKCTNNKCERGGVIGDPNVYKTLNECNNKCTTINPLCRSSLSIWKSKPIPSGLDKGGIMWLKLPLQTQLPNGNCSGLVQADITSPTAANPKKDFTIHLGLLTSYNNTFVIKNENTGEILWNGVIKSDTQFQMTDKNDTLTFDLFVET